MSTRMRVLGLCAVVFFFAVVSNVCAISFLQVNSATPQTPQSTVAVTYTSAQSVGNLNIVVVGWNDSTAVVSSVTDTTGNVYQLAVGPTARAGVASQSIYYAKNIAGAPANGNVVTVRFNVAAIYPDIRILEYSGLDVTSPVDVTAAAQGNNATSNSGAVTTRNPNDLLFAANLVQTSTRAAGTGFTGRVITAPDGDIAEDRIVSATGSYNATAPLTSAGPWIMQMVAFKAAGPGSPDLTISKTHTGNFTQGQTGATYTITVANSGTGPTSGTVTVTDTLPSGLTATALSGTGWTCTLSSCTRSDVLAASASYPAITLTVNVASNAPASVTNTATVSGGGETNTANNTANNVTTINPIGSPDLTISKTHTGNFTQGQTGATYTITVANSGTGPTSGTVTVTDTLPSGLTATALSGTGWTCTLSSCTRSDVLAASASYPAITLTVNVASNAPASVTNTATVSGGGETNTANNTANNVTTINPIGSPDLTISKTHTGNFTQGQTGATYTITVANSGTGPTSGTVTVTDTLPSGLTATALSGTGWTCTLSSCTRSDVLAASASYPAITLTVNVASNAPASVTNTATVSGGGETNTANNTANNVTTINPIGSPDLTISKTHTGNFTQGQTGATYTITVANSGTGPTSGTVTVTDTLPSGLTATALSGTGWTCTLSSCTRSDVLAASASYPAITLTVNVASNAPASVTNTATVSGGGETNTANNTANNVTTINPIGSPDLTISKTHTGNFTQGQTGATYTITVANSGTGPTSGTVTVTDTLPSGLTATALSGTGWTCTLSSCTRSDVLAASASYPAITLTVNVASNAPASVTNTATVSGGGETNTTNNTANDVTVIGNTIPGLVAAYSFNEGTGTTVADAAGNGNTGTITNATWTGAGKYGSALVFNGTNALVTINDSTSLHLTTGMTLEAWVNPSIASSAWRDVIYKGNDNYFLEGTSSASGVPAGGGTFGSAGAEIYGTAALAVNTWSHLAVTYDGATLRLYVNGTQVSSLARTGSIPTSTNPLQIGGDSLYGQFFTGMIDEVRIYNVALTAAQIQADMSAPIGGGNPVPLPDLTISKTHTGNFTPGQTGATYTITVANGGTGPTSGLVTVTDTLPAPLTATALISSGWGCTLTPLTCTRSDVLAASASYPAITLTVNVASNAPASVTNTATVSGGGETNTTNNTANDVTVIGNTIPGLVAAYSFNEGTGTTVADAAGNGNTGTITNATWTGAGKYGSALVFNGTNALVTINDSTSLHLTTGMTLEAWVNPSIASSAWRDVIYKGNDNYFLEGTSSASGVPAGGGTFGSAGAEIYGTAALAVNTWSHLAVTYDGATLRLYVNGTQVSSLARTGSIPTSTNPLQIGGDSLYGQFFTGMIDEVRIYNVALTAAQIQADMSAPIGNPTMPGNLTATVVSGTQINLAWTASTGNLTVTGYFVERCQGAGCTNFAQIAAPTGTTYNDTTVVANTNYSYRVRATDSAGNLSPYSIVANAYTGLSITPRVDALTFTQTQQFTANETGVIWSVDGVVGGSASSGTITVTGLYTPPPTAGTHTVTATTSDGLQSGSVTVYVTNYPGTLTHHNDNFRTGQNLSETVLTPTNINFAQFGKLFSYALDQKAHASPLYVANVNIPGQGFHNVVYVATEHDSVYAFDADGRSPYPLPLWQKSFINPAAGVTTVPPADTGETGDIVPEIGITGTPVIDLASGTLYVVAKTKEVVGSTISYVQRLHALDITTGAEKFGGPVPIQASVPGSGEGSQGGRVAFDPLLQNQRPALLLANGVVYVGFGTHGNPQAYHGWLLGYNAATLQQVMAFNTTPNARAGGIWHAGGGPALDSAGNIYFVTGNGTFDANTGGGDYGDSVVKINSSGTVLDYFTPYNQAFLDGSDVDLSPGGVLLIPDQSGPYPHLLVSAGKEGTIYLINRDNMGHFNANNDSQIVQSLPNILPGGNLEIGNRINPVYFNGYVYFSDDADTIKAFQLSNGLLSLAPTSQSSEIFEYPGGPLAISANGSANAILWAVQRFGDSPAGGGVVAPGVLRAYDPANLAIELYNSDQAGARDTMDYAAKFTVPLVANGKVFVVGENQLTVYGLLP